MTQNGFGHNNYRLILKNISLRREDKAILKDINLEVRGGEHWAILGPNGSGKTMMMMVASGYQPASGGRVFLVNGWISEIVLPEVRKHIGIISEGLTQHIPGTIPE